jgi:hypothetical protein
MCVWSTTSTKQFSISFTNLFMHMYKKNHCDIVICLYYVNIYSLGRLKLDYAKLFRTI